MWECRIKPHNMKEKWTYLFYSVKLWRTAVRVSLYVVILLFILPSQNKCFGKTQAGHISDMQAVFPFVPGDNRIDELYQLVNDYIDQATFPVKGDRRTRHLDCVMKDPVFSKLGWGLNSNHGYWYHWGFNADIKRYAPLREKINRAISDPNKKFDANEAQRFWSMLNKDRAERNRYLTAKVYPILGYTPGMISARMRAQANALVTVLYDVHMLGDLVEGKGGNKVKADAKTIFNECETAINNLAGNESGNIKKARKLNKLLKAYHPTPTKEADPEGYLNTLKNEFSGFILSLGGDPSYNYKEKWKKMGYNLK